MEYPVTNATKQNQKLVNGFDLRGKFSLYD